MTDAYGSKPTPKKAIEKLKKKLAVKAMPVENTENLAGVRAKLKKGERVRILHLGDSHIAADYISGAIRDRLQDKYGSAGRGFTQIDQHHKYGGRQKSRKEKDWSKGRHVEVNDRHLRFGFSGISLKSKKKGASITYKLKAEDQAVRIYYEQHEKGAPLTVRLKKKVLATVETKGALKSKVATVKLPAGKKKLLTLRAEGKGAKLYGISFEGPDKGVMWEPIGPVGADAKLYLEFDQASYTEHMAAHKPDLIVLMVGGNDALKVRKKWRTIEEVEQNHLDVISVLKKTVPNVECIIWSPMDAGRKKKGKVVSKSGLVAMQALQKRVAQKAGCAFWDMYEVMGGDGSIVKWHKARIMNADLIHPRRKAADLLGHMFADAFLAAMK